MKIVLSQRNPIVGDLENNRKELLDDVKNAAYLNSDLIIFPELFLTGYPPLDLLCYPEFLKNIKKEIDIICNHSTSYPDIGILFGCVTEKKTGYLYNSALLIQNGNIIFTQHKTNLPNYGVFDEERYFVEASNIDVFRFKNTVLGISICEDAWINKSEKYVKNPISDLSAKGATLLINLSASPFDTEKRMSRMTVFQNHAKTHKIPLIFVNQVGANDELIFDGGSCWINEDGALNKELKFFQEDFVQIDTKKAESIQVIQKNEIETILSALSLGIADYLKKTRFKKVLVGLSGGIDSAVTCAIAVKACGAENVLGVLMPSPYSSDGSISDSVTLAKNLNIEHITIPIESQFKAVQQDICYHTNDQLTDLTSQNIQSRLRGLLLMSLANNQNRLLLSTGNKSELAVGYCTLYGDMNGAISVLGDVYKTKVYELANYINKDIEIIPIETIKKAPSAELKPNQKDTDSLPDYNILDEILFLHLERKLSKKEIVDNGFDEHIVSDILRKVNLNEYKRQQAAMVLKITQNAFGLERRMPIAATYDFQ